MKRQKKEGHNKNLLVVLVSPHLYHLLKFHFIADVTCKLQIKQAIKTLEEETFQILLDISQSTAFSNQTPALSET